MKLVRTLFAMFGLALYAQGPGPPRPARPHRPADQFRAQSLSHGQRLVQGPRRTNLRLHRRSGHRQTWPHLGSRKMRHQRVHRRRLRRLQARPHLRIRPLRQIAAQFRRRPDGHAARHLHRCGWKRLGHRHPRKRGQGSPGLQILPRGKTSDDARNRRRRRFGTE